MFWKRVTSAIIFAFIVIAIIHKGGSWGFLGLITIAVILSSIEFLGLVPSKKNVLLSIIIISINCLLCFSPLYNEIINVNLLLCISVILSFIYVIIKRETKTSLVIISASALCVLYIGLMFGYHIVSIRQMPNGREIIYYLLGVTWSSDIGAYLIGRWFGKHKIIPSISPKKSLEGYIAGLIFGIGTSIAICSLLRLEISITHAVILGAILTVIGQFGDLAESILKRNAGIKDSGKLMPGHGGILDRCDSLIFITPTLYYYAIYILKLAGD